MECGQRKIHVLYRSLRSKQLGLKRDLEESWAEVFGFEFVLNLGNSHLINHSGESISGGSPDLGAHNPRARAPIQQMRPLKEPNTNAIEVRINALPSPGYRYVIPLLNAHFILNIFRAAPIRALGE